MNRIINMIIHQVTRHLINRGVRMGIDKAGSMGRGKDVPEQGAQLSPEERRRKRQANRMARQAKQSLKIMRRM